MKVKVLRATVIQGRPRVVGELLEITEQDLHRLGGRVEKIDVDDAEPKSEPTAPEPEKAVNTTAMHASLVGAARTSRRK